MSDLEVATTILAQLGGRSFLAMTGAYHLLGTDNSLRFKLPQAKDGINLVTITFNGRDLYDMKFEKFDKNTLDRETVYETSDIFADMLCEVIEEHTGLILPEVQFG